MNNDKLHALYTAASKKFTNLGTEEEFAGLMSDASNREAFHSAASEYFGNLGTLDEFNKKLGFFPDIKGKPLPQDNYIQQAPAVSQSTQYQQGVTAQPYQYQQPVAQQQPVQARSGASLPNDVAPTSGSDYGTSQMLQDLQRMQQPGYVPQRGVDFDSHQVGMMTPQQTQQAVKNRLLEEANQRVAFSEIIQPVIDQNAAERMNYIQQGGDPILAYAMAKNPLYQAEQVLNNLDEDRLTQYIQKVYGQDLGSMSEAQQKQVRDAVAQQIESFVIDDYMRKNQIKGDGQYILQSAVRNSLAGKIGRALGNAIAGEQSRRLEEIEDNIIGAYSQNLEKQGILKQWAVNGAIGAGTIALDAPFFAMFDMPIAWFRGLHGAKYLFNTTTQAPKLLGSAISQGINWGLYGMTGTVADRAANTYINEQGKVVTKGMEYDENGQQVEVERPLTFGNFLKDTAGSFGEEFTKGALMGSFFHLKSPFARKGSMFRQAATGTLSFGLEGALLTGMSAGTEMLKGAKLDSNDIASMLGENYAMIGLSRLNPTHMLAAVDRWNASNVRPEYLDLLNTKGYSSAHVLQMLARSGKTAEMDQASLDAFKADYEKLMSDSTIPLRLRLQFREVVEGKTPSDIAIPRTASIRAVEMIGGKWVVETLDTSGQVTDFTVVRSQEEAQSIIESNRIQAEIENTNLDMLETSLGSIGLVNQAADAALVLESVNQALVDPTARVYTLQELAEARWAQQQGIATPEQQQILKQVSSTAFKSYKALRDYNVREAAKRAAKTILGDNNYVKVKEAVETERQNRNPEQQALVDEYRKQLEAIISENEQQMDAYTEAVATAVQNAMSEVNDLSNTTTGELITATTYESDEPVHITGGNIVTDAEGNIDFEASSKHVLVRDADGNLRMMDIRDIASVESRMTAEEYRKQVEDAAKAEQARKIAEETERKVEAAEEQNKADEEVEKQVEAAATEETEGAEAPTEDGKRYKYYDAEDNEYEGEIVDRTPDGKVRFRTNDGREMSLYEDQLEAIPGSEAPKTEAAATAEKPLFDMPKTGTLDTESGVTVDETGEPVLSAMEPQAAVDYLNDVLKLDPEAQLQYVVNKMNEASDKSSELMRDMPKMGTSITEYQKAKAEWEKAVDAWDKEYQHYNEMFKALKGESYFPSNEDGSANKPAAEETEARDASASPYEIGFNPGAHSDLVSKEDSDLIGTMAKQWGIPVVAATPDEMPQLNGARGFYDKATNTIYLNVANKSGKHARWIMGHEITHKIKDGNPAKYDALVTAMREYLGDRYNSELDRMSKLYGQLMDNQNISDPEARKAYVEEEMVSDLAGDLLDTNTDFARKVMEEAQKDSDYAVMHLGLVRDTINFLRDVMRSFSHLFDPADADRLYDTRRAWEDCYREAVKTNGAKGIKFSLEEPVEDNSIKDTVKPEEVEQSNREAEIKGGVLHDEKGHSFAVVDNSGNITPKYCLETASDFQDNLGEWHKGTHDTVLDYMRSKGYSKKQVKAMDEKMSWWENYMRSISDFQNEDGSFRFEAFREWNQRTPEYKSIGQRMEKALTSLINNGEYPINLELTTDCIKREAFTQLLNEMVTIDDGRAIRNMNPAEITAIQDMMKTYGIQTACPLCFVEGKRLGIRNWAERIVHDWNCQLNDALDLGVEKVKVPLPKKGEFYYAIDANAVAEAIEKKFGTTDSRFNFGQGDYVSETSLDAMSDMSERQRQAKLINDTFDLLSGRRGGLLPDDLQTIEANAKAVEQKLLELENDWYQKNPDKPYQMTAKDAELIAKMQNDGIKTVAGRMAQTISQYPELRKVLTINDLIGSTGLDAIRTRNGEGFERLFSHIVSRFGAGTPKVVQRAEPYVGEILSLGNEKIDAANKIGGSRLFSFSDFDVTKVFDIMQIFFDAEARGLKLQSYSKEVPYILMFGRGTGAKINMSTLVEAKPLEADIEAYRNAKNDKQRREIKHRIEEYAGLSRDENGNISGFQWSGTHSVSPEFAEAIYRNPDYNANCGATTVGVSVNHTIYSCLTPWIRQVIPFHLSGMPIAARERTDVGWYRDATSEQNTRAVAANGKATAISHKDDFDFYAGEDQKGWDMRDRCRKYVLWCYNRGYIPRFEWCLNSDGYIKFCEDNGYTPDKQILEGMRANEHTVLVTDENGKKNYVKMFDGYYKVITDFNCYKPEFDADGNFIGEKIAPHGKIKADFVKDEQMLGAIFTDEDSMLQNREDNIRNANDQVTDLAYKAIKMLKGEITLDEAKNPSSEAFRNAEDAEKYLQSVKEGRFSLDEESLGEKTKALRDEINAGANPKKAIKRWLKEDGHLELAQHYSNGNVLDPDEARKLLTVIGYNGSNGSDYASATIALQETIYANMLDNAVKSGNPTVTLMTGAGGSGKSYSVRNNKDIDLTSRGMVYDAALTSYDAIDKAISDAVAKGIDEKDMQIIAVYNDILTTFQNAISRYKKEGRALPLKVILKQFADNNQKISKLLAYHPDIDIIALDNTGNNGGKRVSKEEAARWNYMVDEDTQIKLLDIIRKEISDGTLTKQQAEAVSQGLLNSDYLTDKAKAVAQEVVSTIQDNARYSLDDVSKAGDIRALIDTSDVNDEQKKDLASKLEKVDAGLKDDFAYVDKLIKDNFITEIGHLADRDQRSIDKLNEKIEAARQNNQEFDMINALIERNKLQKRIDNVVAKLDEAGLERTPLDLDPGEVEPSFVYNLFDRFNKDEDSQVLFDKVRVVANELGLSYSFTPLVLESGKSYNGITSTGHITYNTSAFNSKYIPDARKAQTILHEMLHGISEYVFKAYNQDPVKFGNAFTPSQRIELRKAVEDIKSVYGYLKDDPEFKNEYGKAAYFEAFAEMSNPRFRQKLKDMNLWERFVDGIKRLFNTILNPSDKATTGYDKMQKALDSILKNTDPRFFTWLDNRVGEFVNESNIRTLEEDVNKHVQTGDETRFSLDEQDRDYMDAVNSGDMKKAQQMVDAKAEQMVGQFSALQDDSDVAGFKYHRGEAPKRTFKRYAVFNVSPEGFKAAYAGNKVATPVGVWLDAQNLDSYTSDMVQFDDGSFASYILGDTGASVGSKFSKAKQEEYGLPGSSRLLLERGGKHSSDVPNFSQMNLGKDENGNKVTAPIVNGALPHNKLIFEIEYGISENGDLTEYVRENGRMMKGKNQGLAKINPNEFYDFKTNPNATGNWGIGGTFRITRLVPHEEIVSKTEEYKQNTIAEANRLFEEGDISRKERDKRIDNAEKLQVQKWVGGYHPEEFGLSVESVDKMFQDGLNAKLTDAVTYDDNGNVIPLSQRFSERQDLRYSIDEAEKEVNTDPTEAQKKAGNYRMGHVKVDGYNITIENPKGSVRRGTDANGKAWETPMNNTYGYIRGTEGVDGDHIDIFLSDNPEEGKVYVVDQVDPETGKFDEHKVMFGFNSADEARKAYLSNYTKGWKGLGNITEVSKDEFKLWISSSHRKTKPFADYAIARGKAAEAKAGFIGEPGSFQDLNTGRDEADKKRSMMKFNAALPENLRKQIVSEMRSSGSYDIAAATLKHLAELAEARDNSPLWKDVAKAMSDVYGVKLSEGEAKYMAWRTYRNENPSDYSRTGKLAEDYAMRLHCGLLGDNPTPPGGGGRRDQTESKEFKSWFGKSKVVDESGKPLAVYHGTADKDLNRFDGNAWFTSSAESAEGYRQQRTEEAGGEGAVKKTYLSMQKPFIVDAEGKPWNEIAYDYEVYDEAKDKSITFNSKEEALRYIKENNLSEDDMRVSGIWDTNEIAKYAKEHGYDGAIIKNVYDPAVETDKTQDDYVVFDGRQVKSATDNTGSFDPANPDIRYAIDNDGDLKRKITENGHRYASPNEKAVNVKVTSVSSDFGAKIIKNIDEAIEAYKKIDAKGRDMRGFLPFMSSLLGIEQQKNMPSKKYRTFKLDNGTTVTVRLGGHNTSVKNFDNNGEFNALSIVLSPQRNRGINNNGKAHVIEYFYPIKDVLLFDGKAKYEILKSLRDALSTGTFKDSTGVAQREEVNYANPEYREMLDDIYMAAVESGDNTTVEAMVRDAVKNLMPNTKVVDEDGNPLVVYHGSRTPGFTIFDTSLERNGQNLGSHFGTKDASKTFGDKPYAVYLDIKNPYTPWLEDFFTNEDQLYAGEAAHLARKIGTPEAMKIYDEIVKKYPIAKDEDSINTWLDSPTKDEESTYTGDPELVKRMRKLLELGGYDGIIYNNWYEDPGNDSYVVLSPEQIKSADPVTFDNGKVIPLSKRFDSNNPDIRYSLDESTGVGLGTDDRTPEQKAMDSLMEDLRRYNDELRAIEDANVIVGYNDNTPTGRTRVQERPRAVEISNKLRDFVRNRLSPITAKHVGPFATDRILRLLNAARTKKDLEPIVREIQKTISQAEIAAEIEEMDKVIKTKTQSLTPKGLAKGVLVDSDTHMLLEQIRGSYRDLLLTSKDDELKAINKQLRDLKAKYMLDSFYDPNAPQEFKDELAPLMEQRDKLQKERNEIMKGNVNATVADLENRENEINGLISDAIERGEEPSKELLSELISVPIRKRLAEVRQMQQDLKDIRQDQDNLDTRTSAGRAEWERLDREYMITQRRIVAQTKGITAELKDLISEGRSKRAEMLNADIERQKHIIHIAFEALHGFTPLDPLDKSQRTPGENFVENMKKMIVKLNSPVASLDFILRFVDHNNPSGEGDFYDFFMKSDEGAVQSRDRYTQGLREYNQSLADKALELFGDPDKTYKNEDKRKAAALKAWKDLINDSRKTLKDSPIHLSFWTGEGQRYTNERYMNKGQMLNTWLTWRQEAGKVKLQGQGFDEAAIKQIEGYLGDKWLKFGEWVTEEFFPRLREEKYNPEYEKVYGTSLHRAAHYFPLNIDKGAIHDSDEIGETKQKNMPSSASKHEIVRSQNRLPIDLSQNALDVMLKYGQDMERTTAYAMFTKNLNVLVHSLGFGKMLDAQVEGLYKRFKAAAAVATESYQPDLNDATDFWGKLHSSFMQQAISLRIYSAVKQTLSYPAFGIYSPDKDFQKRFYGYVFTPRKNWKWAQENLESFRSREETGDFGQELLKADNIFDFLRADRPHSNKVTQAIANVATWYRNNGMWFNKSIDGLTVAAGARAVYDYDYKRFKAEGMSHEEADKKAKVNATIAFNQSQQSSRPEFSSPIQKDKDLLSRSVTAFQSSNIAYHKIAIDGVKDMVEGHKAGDKATAVRGLMKILNVGLLNGLWWAGLNPATLYGWLSGNSTDEEQEEAKDALLTNLAIGYLANGTVAGPAVNAWLDSETDYQPLQVFSQINTAVKNSRKALKDDNYGTVAMIATDYLAQAAGVNISTFNSMFESVANPIARGKVKADDILSFINLSKTNRKQFQAMDTDKTFPEYMDDYFDAARMHYIPEEPNAFVEQVRSVYNKAVEGKDKGAVMKMFIKYSEPEYDSVFTALNNEAKAIDQEAKVRFEEQKLKGKSGDKVAKAKEQIMFEIIEEHFPEEDLRNYFKRWYLNQDYSYDQSDGKKVKASSRKMESHLFKAAIDAAKAYNPKSEDSKGSQGTRSKATEAANNIVWHRHLELKNFHSAVSEDSWKRFLDGYVEPHVEDVADEAEE